MALFVQCSYVNKTKGHMIGEDPEPFKAFTNDRGVLFRSCRKEYGRCISKMYRDVKDAPPKVVGWVFEGRDHYEDTSETYLREVWVEVIEKDDPEDDQD
jgi:hypothetical protein